MLTSWSHSEEVLVLLSRSSQQRDCGFMHGWCPSVCLFVCLSPKCKKRDFSQKVSNLELFLFNFLLTTYRKLCKLNWLFKEPIIGSLQSMMANSYVIWRKMACELWMTSMSRKPQAVTSRRSENYTDQSVAWNRGFIWSTYINNHGNWR